MKKKRNTRIVDALNSMDKKDIYSLMLFALYRMKDNPDFLTLSELCYLIDGNVLPQFLSYFGGMTITFPTLEEFNLLSRALLIFQFVNIEKGDFEQAIRAIETDEYTEEKLKDMYSKVLEVMKEYDFSKFCK